MRKLVLPSLLLLLPSIAAAQYPRPSHALLGWFDIANHLATAVFAGEVIVAPKGGNFKTIGEAVAYVTAQNPTPQAPWFITVERGAVSTGTVNQTCHYTETGWVTPPSTLIQGRAVIHPTPVGFTSAPVVCLTGAGGTLVKLQSGSQMSHLTLIDRTPATAAVKLLEMDWSGQSSGQPAVISDVALITTSAVGNAFAVDGLTITHGALYGYGFSILLSGNALGTGVVVNETTAAFGVTLYGGRCQGSTGCTSFFHNVSTASLKLYGVRVDPKCAADLKNDSTGLLEVHQTDYTTSSGTITDGVTHANGGTALPATCSNDQLFINTTTHSLCWCEGSGNTWKCAAGS